MYSICKKEGAATVFILATGEKIEVYPLTSGRGVTLIEDVTYEHLMNERGTYLEPLLLQGMYSIEKLKEPTVEPEIKEPTVEPELEEPAIEVEDNKEPTVETKVENKEEAQAKPELKVDDNNTKRKNGKSPNRS